MKECTGLIFYGHSTSHMFGNNDIETETYLTYGNKKDMCNCKACILVVEKLKNDLNHEDVVLNLAKVQNGSSYRLEYVESGGTYEYPSDIDVAIYLTDIKSNERFCIYGN